MLQSYRRLVGTLVTFALAGCASTPEVEYVEIPAFKSVAIVKAEDMPSIERIRESQEIIADSASVGVASGGAAGLAAGVLLCGTTGPLAGLCISGLGLAGVLTGGAGGLIHGAVNDAEGKYAESINKNLANIGEKYDLQNEILIRLKSEVPSEYVLEPKKADIVVSPILSQINVEQPDAERMYLRLTGNLVFSWSTNDGEEYFGRAEFDYKSTTANVKEWHRSRGRMYTESVFAGMDDLVNQMSERILVRLKHGSQTLEIDH